MPARVVITGANGAVGRTLVRLACVDSRKPEVVATVRSDRAASEVPEIPAGRGDVCQISWDEPGSLGAACAGASSLVHLPGVLVERRGSSYERANVETTRLAIEAVRACGVGKLVLVSAVGADASSTNRYLRSKGEADDLVRESGAPFTVLRAPLVLGPGTEGARALARETSRSSVRLLGGGRTLHRPLDVRDLARGILRAALDIDVARDRVLDLAGPETLTYRELVERAARARGCSVRIGSLPPAPLRLLLALRARLLGPGFSTDALDVLLSDTQVDPGPAADALGIQLTPLDATIRASLGAEGEV